MPADINESGLLTPAESSLLTDHYELTMAESYLRRGMDQPVVFELFVRHLPAPRDWLLVAGLGPALSLVEALRFGARYGLRPSGRWRTRTSCPSPRSSRPSAPSSRTSRRTASCSWIPTTRSAASATPSPPPRHRRAAQGRASRLRQPARALGAARTPPGRCRDARYDDPRQRRPRRGTDRGAGGRRRADRRLGRRHTDLRTSRDAPAVGGVYKLVATRDEAGWRPVAKRSPAKATLPGVKQVFREYRDGRMCGDILAETSEELPGDALVVPVMRDGVAALGDGLAEIRARAAAQLRALPGELRRHPERHGAAYPVRLSPSLRRLTASLQYIEGRAH